MTNTSSNANANASDSANTTATDNGFLTPLPRMAARMVASTLQRAHRLHAGKPPSLPSEPFAVNLNGLGFALEFSATTDNHVEVTSRKQTQLETVINATPASLALQAANAQPGGRIEIQGDATLAQRWQHYFAGLNPDWEQGFSGRLGPVFGYQLSQALKQWLAAAKSNTRNTGEMLGEYLQEESRLLVTRTEMQHFLDDVDDVTERVERLQARLSRR